MKKAKWGAQALLFVLVLTMGLTLTACLNPGVGPGGRFNPVGTWSLVYMWDSWEFSYTLTLRANGTATLRIREEWMSSSSLVVQSAEANGTYIVSDNTIWATFTTFSDPYDLFCCCHRRAELIILDSNTLILMDNGHGYVLNRTR